jgi:serine protease Do
MMKQIARPCMHGVRPLALRVGVIGLFLLILASACNLPAPTPLAPIATPTDLNNNNNNNNTPTSGLTRQQRSYLSSATVRIWGVQLRSGGDPILLYNGSGTIITPDGLILTNCHVADPVAMGYSEAPDALLIDITERDDRPPVSTYYAEVMASDPTLDLAVIKITSRLDGTQVNPSDLNLPYVPLGDSDQLGLGDPLYVFGFPGIGGDSITFTSGSVSGFDSEAPIGNRAWIKTDATIAGGNSGGLASDDQAHIIGVPSQAGTGTAVNTTDCRVIQDTNGDGQINSSDTCIPIGGFINGIRPVNWALPLIDAARAEKAYLSPYDSSIVNPQVTPGPLGDIGFDLVGWSQEWGDDGCPTNAVRAFPSGVKTIAAIFSYSNVPGGVNYSTVWFYDGRQIANSEDSWTFSEDDLCFPFFLENGGDVLPDGSYTFELYLDSTQVVREDVTVGGGGNVDPAAGVTLQGRVTDANTGKGIKGILVVILRPGEDPDAWINDPQEASVYTYVETDVNGDYRINTLLARGETYGVVVGNNELGYAPITGYLEVTAEDPSVLELPIELSK